MANNTDSKGILSNMVEIAKKHYEVGKAYVAGAEAEAEAMVDGLKAKRAELKK